MLRERESNNTKDLLKVNKGDCKVTYQVRIAEEERDREREIQRQRERGRRGH